MKTEMTPATEEKLIAFVACAGSAAGKARFANCASCKEACESGFQRGECKSGCVGVGSCIESCKEGAMKLVDGKIVIDREKCNGCGDCAKEDVCPQHLIKMIPADATTFIPCSSTEDDEQVVRATCGYGCISCGACEQNCPENAVHIVNNHAVIDYDKCVGCVACTVKCKKKIIVDTLHDLTALKSTVAFVKCSGDGRTNYQLQQMGITSCDEAAKLDLKALNLCHTGCFGCGKCTEVCRYDAIHVENGIAKVDPDKCVGCKDCTFACPQHLITIVPYKGQKLVACSSEDDCETKAKVCGTGCLFCEDCKANCPNLAIYADGTHTVIDPEICEDCHVCQYVCPRNVIKETVVPEYIFAQREALGIREGE